MKVKELIKELKKQPQNAEIVLWQWINNTTKINYLTFGCHNNLTQNKKYYTILINETIPPINQKDWHKMLEE